MTIHTPAARAEGARLFGAFQTWGAVPVEAAVLQPAETLLDLYGEDPKGVTKLTPELFKSTIVLPAKVPIGSYVVEVFLFADGALLARQTESFRIVKTGFEEYTFNFAVGQPLLYGILSVALAIFVGWFGGFVFRRE